MDGILLIDKPRGWTSFDVVAKVRGILRQAQKQGSAVRKIRVGHTGTLDPLATGLLVLLIGSYTKKAPELTKLDKVYEVTMKLGFISTTGDAEGKITKISDVQPSPQEIAKNLQFYRGEIMQTPPAYSAIKVGGQRAYKLAREGKEVKIEPRKVTIHSITDVSYNYPTVTFTTEVSSGTYIRSLVQDIGEKLGTGAYMSDLRRTKVGHYDIKNAMVMDSLTVEQIYNYT